MLTTSEWLCSELWTWKYWGNNAEITSNTLWWTLGNFWFNLVTLELKYLVSCTGDQYWNESCIMKAVNYLTTVCGTQVELHLKKAIFVYLCKRDTWPHLCKTRCTSLSCFTQKCQMVHNCIFFIPIIFILYIKGSLKLICPAPSVKG